MRMNSRLIAAFAVAAIALAACSSDDADDVDGSTDETTETTDDTADESMDDEAMDDEHARSVGFVNLADGDVVTSPLSLELLFEGLVIEAAGEVNEHAGHFHIMIDTACIAVGEVIPANDDNHRHFGDGSTTVELELEPGEHTLCLQLGDGEHVATEYTAEVTVTVEA